MTSTYTLLADHLGAIGAGKIILTFAEIEAIVGPLPDPARHQSEWWGTTPSMRYCHAHARGWWQAGYVADRPDFVAKRVTFRRVTNARNPTSS